MFLPALGLVNFGCLLNQTWPINENMLRNSNSTWGPGQIGDSDGDVIARQPLLFSLTTSSWNACTAGRKPMLLLTGHANYEKCRGNFIFSNCTMMPAVLEYDITIRGNTITYAPPTILDGVAGLADDYCSNQTVFATAGPVSLMYPLTRSNARLGRWNMSYFSPGEHPIEIPKEQTFTSFGFRYLQLTPGIDPCTFTSYDAMDDIIAQFNDLLLRPGLMVGSWSNITDSLVDSKYPVHQAVNGTITREENVFHSNIQWYCGAASVQILTMLLILPAYWGK